MGGSSARPTGISEAGRRRDSPDIDRRVIEERVSHVREDSVEVLGRTRSFKTIRFPLFDEENGVTAVGGVSLDVTAEMEADRLRDDAAASKKAIAELELSRQETIEGLAMAIDLTMRRPGVTPRGWRRSRRSSVPVSVSTAIVSGCCGRRRRCTTREDRDPAEILRKAGPLTAEERSEMERHTVIGHEIFSKFESDLSRPPPRSPSPP